MTERSSSPGDPERLHEQVKLLVRTEHRLSRSQGQLDRELGRIRALSELVLESPVEETRQCLMSRALKLVAETFDLDVVTAAHRDPEDRWVIVGEVPPAPWNATAEVTAWIGTLTAAGVYDLASLAPASPLVSSSAESPDGSVLVVPLRLDDGDLVAYVAGQKRAESRGSFFRPRPSREDGAFLALLAGHLERVLQNARLRDALRTRGLALETANAQLRESLERLEHAQQQLVQGHKMDAIGRLAGGIAHDFNNLLTVILGGLDLASREGASATANTRVLEQARRAAERAASITRQLLTFARRQPLPAERVDLNAVVRDVAEVLERLVEDDVSITLELDAREVAVMADPGQIEQIVLNLALNARDAMPDGGVIAISTSAGGSTEPTAPGERTFVSLTVQDDGIGIDPVSQERVFEPFFTTKEIGQGTGLGLATVYGIVQQLGGEIRVRSAPRAGSTFTVRLPAAIERTAGDAAVRATPGTRATRMALVVEDESSVRTLLGRMLETCGLGVLLAAGMQEALALLDDDRDHIDLILTDVVMPDGDGFDLAKAVRARGVHVPVVFMSGYPHRDTDRVDETADAFIAKPFTAADLTRTITRVLAERDEPQCPVREERLDLDA